MHVASGKTSELTIWFRFNIIFINVEIRRQKPEILQLHTTYRRHIDRHLDR